MPLGDKVQSVKVMREKLDCGEDYLILVTGKDLVGVGNIAQLICCNTSRELIFRFFLMILNYHKIIHFESVISIDVVSKSSFLSKGPSGHIP